VHDRSVPDLPPVLSLDAPPGEPRGEGADPAGLRGSTRRADIRRLEPAERDAALTSTVAAFATDPLLRWVWPEDDRYEACAPGFFGLLLDLRRAGGEVWAAHGGAAVAMWDPPGGLYARPEPDPWPALQAGFTQRERASWAVYEQRVGERTTQPHWYLGVLATDPARQGQGLARAVVAPVLAACDRTGVDAWLETATAANVGYYRRFGFEVVREVDLPDGGPQCWLLRRAPVAVA
jgi:ribosomal protein S18 acetylase RimI-like enzyme